MITAIVSAITLIVVLLAIVWWASPTFRVWAKKLKYIRLALDNLFECAHDKFNNQVSDPRWSDCGSVPRLIGVGAKPGFVNE